MAQIKQLKEKSVKFYPLTVGQAVVFEDGTNAEITEEQMDLIFGWNRNYISLTTYEPDNTITVTQRIPLGPIEGGGGGGKA